MAMRKEPERRYSSAEQLAPDVERFLEGMPVLARADSWGYRTEKFVRRHRLGVALAVGFLALLIGFTVTVYLQSQRIERERDVAQAERPRGTRERAEAVMFPDRIVPTGDPFAGAATPSPRGRSRPGAARITRELGLSRTSGHVLDTIGSAYLGLGLPEQAQPLDRAGPGGAARGCTARSRPAWRAACTA